MSPRVKLRHKFEKCGVVIQRMKLVPDRAFFRFNNRWHQMIRSGGITNPFVCQINWDKTQMYSPLNPAPTQDGERHVAVLVKIKN